MFDFKCFVTLFCYMKCKCIEEIAFSHCKDKNVFLNYNSITVNYINITKKRANDNYVIHSLIRK